GVGGERGRGWGVIKCVVGTQSDTGRFNPAASTAAGRQRGCAALLTPGSGRIVPKPAPASADEPRRSPCGLVLVQSALAAGVEGCSTPALSLSGPRAPCVDTR